MIISHKYKYIFIKTNKTAGTSIEIALSKYCGPDDVITPISNEDESIRKSMGCRSAQNYLAGFDEYSIKDFARAILKGRKRKFYNHITASEIKEKVPSDVWNNYYKFCVERNPWDRVVSAYFWETKSMNPRPEISKFIDSEKIRKLKDRGFNAYTINGQAVVDHICKFENLDEELENIRLRLGIPAPLELPRAKGGHRKDKKHYRDMLDDTQRQKIEKLFAPEIAMLGYEF